MFQTVKSLIYEWTPVPGEQNAMYQDQSLGPGDVLVMLTEY